MARAVLGKPFNFLRYSQRIAKKFLHGDQHHVTHHIPAMTAAGCYPTHGFSVAASQRKSHAQKFAVLAAELKAV